MRLERIAGVVTGIALLFACSSKGVVPSTPAATAVFAGERAMHRAAAACPKGFLISGTGTDAKLDAFVTAFMCQWAVPNAQFAVSTNGKTTFSHAYTNQAVAISVTTTRTVMRLASNSKPWTGAAIYTLLQDGKIKLSDPVFPALGLTTPLPGNEPVDRRVLKITVQNMIEAKAGWDNDPSFEMRDTAVSLKYAVHLNQAQYVRHQLWQPLAHAPGSYYMYCNFCYDVLGMLVAKKTGTSFVDYLNTIVPPPQGVPRIAVAPTVNRLRNEVAQYFSKKRGLSAFYPTLTSLVPAPYGGDGGVLEVAQGDGGLAASAEMELAFTNRFTLGYGQGPPPPAGKGEYFEGEIAGTSTWAEQLPNCTNYVFDVNSNEFGSDAYAFASYQRPIERYLKKTNPCIVASLRRR
ncbi:MAG: beta-lactamase family protein [Candidatus Eremiobacteraeota bacterium]|nr:beta-lactamase family protein [Candidatus Eremiobacteraeota bacterium]